MGSVIFWYETSQQITASLYICRSFTPGRTWDTIVQTVLTAIILNKQTSLNL